MTVADFNNGAAFPTVAGVTYSVAGGPTAYVLTVDIANDPRVPVDLAFDVASGSGSISPPPQDAAAPLSLRYEPPVPTFSSSVGDTGTPVHASTFTITAAFDKAVTGVAPSDFGLTSSNAAVGLAATVASADNKNWVLTVSVTSNEANTDLTVTMPVDSGAITNKNAAATNNGFELLYRPPQPVLTSTSGPTTTTNAVIAVTATFSSAVTGVTVSDFNSGTPFPVVPGVTYAVTGSGTQWVLTVTLNENPKATRAFNFDMSAGSGSISPPNQPSPAALPLTCVTPPCSHMREYQAILC